MTLPLEIVCWPRSVSCLWAVVLPPSHFLILEPFHSPLPLLASSVVLVHESSHQGGLATAFDLAAFRLSMIAPVKKSVNHPKTVASMRGTGWENNKFVLAASSISFPEAAILLVSDSA